MSLTRRGGGIEASKPASPQAPQAHGGGGGQIRTELAGKRRWRHNRQRRHGTRPPPASAQVRPAPDHAPQRAGRGPLQVLNEIPRTAAPHDPQRGPPAARARPGVRRKRAAAPCAARRYAGPAQLCSSPRLRPCVFAPPHPYAPISSPMPCWPRAVRAEGRGRRARDAGEG